jgi:hypothetical protein
MRVESSMFMIALALVSNRRLLTRAPVQYTVQAAVFDAIVQNLSQNDRAPRYSSIFHARPGIEGLEILL